MRISRIVVALVLAGVSSSASVAGQSRNNSAPETFSANAQVTGRDGGLAVIVGVRIERYTSDKDRETMAEALRVGGYAGFLAALRKAPEVGYVEVEGKKVVARWAREQPTEKGRTIVVVTDHPVFFVGGGKIDAKPREGYDLAVVQLDVDDIGLGTGSMAAAARVRPGGTTGVELDDYADQPIKFVTVRRSFR